jgi:hypothetical protein
MHAFIWDILANMTQVSNVAPGPLVWIIRVTIFSFLKKRKKKKIPVLCETCLKFVSLGKSFLVFYLSSGA